MKKVIKLIWVLPILIFGCKEVKEEKPITPPNVIWINADDLGRELACYGNPDIKTPNLDQLAQQGTLYTNAYANAPICSSSRSSQIAGMYPTTINCLDHRTINMTELQDGIKPITEYFKEAGYFIANGSGRDYLKKGGKRDYNFIPDIKYPANDWSERAKGQPFFAQVQIKYPHRVFERHEQNPINPETVTLPGCYPDHPLLKADWALYLESVQKCDDIVGWVMKRLEDEGLADNTAIFFFGDHGRPHLRDKQFLYEGGLQIPLIVRLPEHVDAGKIDKRLVSLVDVAATSLELAGIESKHKMHGKVFIGDEQEKRDYVFGFRQRAGDAPDAIRSITDGRYKLIWNQEPERPWMQLSSYKRSEYPAFTVYRVLHKNGELKAPYNQFMADSRPEFEFFDLETDPHEFNNLVSNRDYQEHFNRLKSVLQNNLKEYDKNQIPESEETIQKGKNGSQKYFKTKMKKLGLPEAPSDEELLLYWNKTLIKAN
ncbi:sulfatase family protein [Seonamhaeicola maritimus]|uniref:Sulfatase n=1 Tax=Seonamhaeicola maritimus TaxID=2591822 RepID=A0A5C7GG13_9FLAO|nr:sulfatase [Seonamhaeicola maritimus]TXG36093.1 sulfatase [Seonamhaeicola maritimus]